MKPIESSINNPSREKPRRPDRQVAACHCENRIHVRTKAKEASKWSWNAEDACSSTKIQQSESQAGQQVGQLPTPPQQHSKSQPTGRNQSKLARTIDKKLDPTGCGTAECRLKWISQRNWNGNTRNHTKETKANPTNRNWPTKNGNEGNPTGIYPTI